MGRNCQFRELELDCGLETISLKGETQKSAISLLKTKTFDVVSTRTAGRGRHLRKIGLLAADLCQQVNLFRDCFLSE